MKPRCTILLCTLVLALHEVSGAATLYSQTFSSTSTANLNNTPVGGGTLSASWKASNTTTTGTIANFRLNGTTNGQNGSAILPFVPASGMIYTATATVGTTNTNWGGVGFTNASATWLSANDRRFTGGEILGQPWMIHSGTQSAFAGPGAASTGVVTGTSVAASLVTLTVELNTVGAAWTTSFFVNGTQFGSTYIYMTNPTINAVGITTTGNGTRDFSDFSLTAVPEPSAALLGGLGVVALLRRRR